MIFAETEGAAPNRRYFGRSMDARTIARAAHVGIGTLNSWAHRRLVPGLLIGARGRRRDIDIGTATRIILFAELVNIGIPANKASGIVAGVEADTGLLWIGYNESQGQGPYTVTALPLPLGSDLVHALGVARKSRHDFGWTTDPPLSLIVWVPGLVRRALDAEAEWRAEQGEGR